MKTKTENKKREFNFTRNTISHETDSAKVTAIKFNCTTSKEFQESCATWLKNFYQRNKSAKVKKENIINNFAYLVKTSDLIAGGKFLLKNDTYEIIFYITPQGVCGENSGIPRKRQYIYFPDTDIIVLSDDVWTGFYPRLKKVLQAKGIDLNQFGTFTKNGKKYVKY